MVDLHFLKRYDIPGVRKYENTRGGQNDRLSDVMRMSAEVGPKSRFRTEPSEVCPYTWFEMVRFISI